MRDTRIPFNFFSVFASRIHRNKRTALEFQGQGEFFHKRPLNLLPRILRADSVHFLTVAETGFTNNPGNNRSASGSQIGRVQRVKKRRHGP